MIPTVLMLNPEALTFTAKVRMAPTTSRKMLTPRLKLLASSMTPASFWWGSLVLVDERPSFKTACPSLRLLSLASKDRIVRAYPRGHRQGCGRRLPSPAQAEQPDPLPLPSEST